MKKEEIFLINQKLDNADLPTVVSQEDLQNLIKKQANLAATLISQHNSGTLIYEKDNISHNMPLNKLVSDLKTDLIMGLTNKEAEERLLKDGRNILNFKQERWILKILGYLVSGFCPLLWVCGSICILAWKPFGEPNPQPINLGLAAILYFVALFQAFFTGIQDYTSSKILRTIRKMMPNFSIVCREGKEFKISAEELIVGDIVNLAAGMKVPADIRLVEAIDLTFDKSILTGESEPVEASVEESTNSFTESKNIAFMSSLVISGKGRGVVIATGQKTFIGIISESVTKTKELPTNIQKEIRRFVILLTCCAIFASTILIIGWAAWLNKSYPDFLTPINLVDNMIGLMVSFIPEGLPFCIALGLLIMAKKLAENRILVKNLSIIETLGCLNILASDKTGTLTENKMTVVSISIGNKEAEISQFNLQYLTENPGIYQVISTAVICNNAQLENESDGGLECKAKGDATDISLLKFGTKYLGNINDSYNVLKEIPFNSINKWMLKLVELKKNNNCNVVLLMKGAPDIVINKCKYILNEAGEIKPLNLTILKELFELQKKWAMEARRVILLVSKICDRIEETSLKTAASTLELEEKVQHINDFCVEGLVGLIDPPRNGISDVINVCKGAGIRVFMVTGDFKLTAISVAKQIGILTTEYDSVKDLLANSPPKNQVMSCQNSNQIFISNDNRRALAINGNQLKKLSKEDWVRLIKYDEIVFSRVTPQQKLEIVKAFQQDINNVVGVTGDGVNDAPALKCANVGIAMGGGTDLAIESSHIVLLDNNFKSIQFAILMGRLIFQNLRKIMIYAQSAGEFSEIMPLFVNVFMGAPLPLSTFLMIVICVLTDVPAELALVMEQPEANLIKLPPRNQKKNHLVNLPLMFQSYFCIGMIECICSHFLFFWYMQEYWGMKASWALFSYGDWQDGYRGFTQDQLNEMVNTGQSIYFANLVIMQCIGNFFATRTLTLSIFQHNPFKGETKNKYCFIAIPVSLIVMLLVIYIPPCNSVLGTSPIPVEFYFISLAFSMTIILYDEIRKLLKRKKLLGFQHSI